MSQDTPDTLPVTDAPAEGAPWPPFETEADAKAAADAFMSEVSALREKYGVPDVVIAVAVYLKSGTMLTSIGARGNPVSSALLAASMYGTFAAPMVQHAKHVAALAGLPLEDADKVPVGDEGAADGEVRASGG